MKLSRNSRTLYFVVSQQQPAAASGSQQQPAANSHRQHPTGATRSEGCQKRH
ncbi:MAG TPA: hypothetical protein VHA06_18940 [Candidatus Angelobacter sp.]|nr:hypothetical protein [Candidatus Angelobacter sp.]